MRRTHETRMTKQGPVTLTTIDNGNGLEVVFTDYGAAIHRIMFDGKDVAVTPYDIDDFLTSENYYGKTVGRTAGRMFSPSYRIGDRDYPVRPFKAQSSKLHGGPRGLSFRRFGIMDPNTDDEGVIIYHITSPDMDEDYPGNVDLTVTYRVTEDNRIVIRHQATTDKDTVLNLTNHVYVNLDIPGTILGHLVRIDADKVVDIHPDHRPKGLLDVTGTPFDFRTEKRLGKAISEMEESPFQGFDHCFVLNSPGLLEPSMTIRSEASDMSLSLYTDYPAVVVYTHNLPTPSHLEMFDGQSIHRGITLECQYEPGGIHHPDLSDAILRAKDTYDHTMMLAFRRGGR
jgi:aldose 1-epimerase